MSVIPGLSVPRWLVLYKDCLNYGQTQWHYFYAEALYNYHLVNEAHNAIV